MASSRCAWSDCVPWLKLSRNTSTPRSNNARMAFSLEVEGKSVLRLARVKALSERVGEVFEVLAEDGFVPLRGGTPPLTVTGFLGRPERADVNDE